MIFLVNNKGEYSLDSNGEPKKFPNSYWDKFSSTLTRAGFRPEEVKQKNRQKPSREKEVVAASDKKAESSASE